MQCQECQKEVTPPTRGADKKFCCRACMKRFHSRLCRQKQRAAKKSQEPKPVQEPRPKQVVANKPLPAPAYPPYTDPPIESIQLPPEVQTIKDRLAALKAGRDRPGHFISPGAFEFGGGR